MRISPIIALLSGALLVGSTRAQFSDNFDDLDFTTAVAWNGSASLFTAATGQLQSQSPGAANYYLSTPSTQSLGGQWEFFVNLKFSTSGVNYADVYLMSSAADLASGVNGYYVRIGGTADRVELFRSDAGTGTSLIVSPDAIVNSSSDNPFKIRVKRDAADLWTLEYDDGALGSYTLAGSIVEGTYPSCTHFGVRIEQSSAAGAVNNHFFDDFVVGPIPVDLTPPTILSVTATSATNVDVQYSEPLDPAFIGTYDITPFIGVSAQVLDGVDPALVHVTPAIALSSGNTYSLAAAGAQDPSGNIFIPGAPIDFAYIVPAVAGPRDVVINELMADPSLPVGLPDAEFIELYNATSASTFDLSGWTIDDGSTTGTITSGLLGPGQFVILADDAVASLFTGFGTVISITSFPSLNNDGDPLTLKDDGGAVIDAITYDLSWYQDGVKDDGGWSLEQIDPTRPCSSAANWIASNDPQGGTPGEQNSVFAIVPDIDPPTLLSVEVSSATEIDLLFNEAMDLASLESGGYAIAPFLPVDVRTAIAADRVRLTLGASMVVGQLYTVTVTNVNDCPGNAIDAGNTASFALPEPVEVGDVVINEVLYDPRVGGYDFVELFNKSNKVLSLANWKLANETDGVITSPTVITGASVLLLPGQYIALTESPANIVDEYPLAHADRLFLADLPSYNNGEGTVVLQAPDNSTLDLFRYSDDLHFALLNGTEGVSLERVDPERASDDNSNWHSAAEAVGWATPGYENSQYSPTTEAIGEMTIEPAIFSPDNDGNQDVLTIAYSFASPGFTGNMTVFDLAGREVRKLLENELLGTSGAISWDGILDDNTLARIGPYVVYFEVFDLAGNTQKLKETIVVAQKLQ